MTEIICTVHAILLHPYWGPAKKWQCEILRAFIKSLRYERRLSEICNTSV
jgi:hypothetical protein